MKIDVALFASLSGCHAVSGDARTRVYDLPDGSRIADVVESLGLPDQPRIVFVNGRHAEETRELHEGERLAIFPPIAGG